MEADLLRFYGVDLAGLWVGGLSLRRLYVLISNLPPESATWAAESGVPMGATATDVILADIFHSLAGEAHALRPTAQVSKDEAKTQHEKHVANLRAQRERIARARKEAPPSVE